MSISTDTQKVFQKIQPSFTIQLPETQEEKKASST